MLNPQRIREMMIQALPDVNSLYHTAVPSPRYVYFPPSHIKSLYPDVLVVEGIRGAGKSFWWAALQDTSIRKLFAQVDRFAQVDERTEIAVGFGKPPSPNQYPDKDTLRQLLKYHEPRAIWRAVTAYALLRDTLPMTSDWRERVAWVENHPQEIGRWLNEKDQKLQEQKTWAIILFDALDHAATRWEDMCALIRGVLQVALELCATRRIRLKVFLRPEQVDRTRVATFPDASKVLASSLSLNWTRPDLYSLLWQRLANTEGSEDLRAIAEIVLDIRWEQVSLNGSTIWRWPRMFRDDEEKHRRLFHMLTGKWMGSDPKRGFPYSWIHGRLSDNYGRVSPRSFLAALRIAAEDTQERYPEHNYALHYKSIQRGVLKASTLRVWEMGAEEDGVSWIDILMNPLRGLFVPCGFEKIQERWEQEGVLEKLQALSEEGKLPPIRLKEGYSGLRKDLEDLGIFIRMYDGRVNVASVFRNGYGIGLAGGVKPLQT